MKERRSDNLKKIFFTDIPTPFHVPADCFVSLDKAPWIPRLGEIITVQDGLLVAITLPSW